jgi:hypothetical protein
MSKKTIRNSFKSLRIHRVVPCRMVTEDFENKDKRNARWASLRTNGKKHVSRLSTSRGGKSIWLVTYPL